MTPRESGADDCCHPDHRHMGYTDPAALRIINRHIVNLVLEANPFLRALAEFRDTHAEWRGLNDAE